MRYALQGKYKTCLQAPSPALPQKQHFKPILLGFFNSTLLIKLGLVRPQSDSDPNPLS